MPKTKAFDDNIGEYEKWFVENHFVFQSEINAIKKAIPSKGKGIEIGIGSGIFAEHLGISDGIEPSKAMREKAKTRNINVVNAVAENLPYQNSSVDFALMVTTICFVDDIYKSFEEVNRVLKNNAELIIGFVDEDSTVGKSYLKHKNESLFYKEATFYSTKELLDILKKTNFEIENIYQTIFGKLNEINEVQEVKPDYGEGSFVVVKAKKKK